MLKDFIHSKIFIKLITINLVLIILSLTFQVLRFKFDYDNPTFTRIFDLNQELNIPTWYESILFIISANLIWQIAKLSNLSLKKYWKTLSIVFVILSIDEVASIHEDLAMYIGNTINTTGIFYHAWIIAAVPAIMILGIWLIPFFKALPRKTFFLFALSASVFIFGAIVIEMVGGQYAEKYFQHNLHYNILATLEESFELIGITIFISTLYKLKLNLLNPNYKKTKV